MTILWGGLIFYLSTRRFGASFSSWLLKIALSVLHLAVSPSAFKLLDLLIRKLAHLTEYGIFALLLFAALEEGDSLQWQLRRAATAVLVAGLYSLTDEFHQRFVPGRTASLRDCGLDTAGATLAMLALYGREWWVHARAARVPASSELTEEWNAMGSEKRSLPR